MCAQGRDRSYFIASLGGSYLAATLVSADYRLMIFFSLMQVIDGAKMRMVELWNTMIIHLPTCMHVLKTFLTKEGTLAMVYTYVYKTFLRRKGREAYDSFEQSRQS